MISKTIDWTIKKRDWTGQYSQKMGEPSVSGLVYLEKQVKQQQTGQTMQTVYKVEPV